MPCPRTPALRLLVAAGLVALLPLAVQADPAGTHLRLEPGVHVFNTPQVFGPDSVLELVLSGGLGCNPCNTQVVFEHTVHFDGTLKLTMDDSFIRWGGHQIWLFSYRGIPDVPGTGLPAGRFHTLDLPPLDPTQGWGTDSLYTNGTVLLAQLVPEPSSLAMWLAGGVLLAGLGRRRRLPTAIRTA
jgi:hypothetical protein